jgi:outer membrane protein assembly factor BamB
MAASPLLVDGLLVIQVDQFGPSYLLGVDAATGKNRWRTTRPTGVNWSSPLAVTLGGTKQIVCAGTQCFRGYAPDTGKELWSFRGLHAQCIPSTVVCSDRLLTAAGRDFTCLALRLDTSPGTPPTPQVAWKVRNRGVGVPSPLCLGGEYYYVEDSGWANCLRADTGERLWRERLNGKHQASLVAGDGKVYFTSEAGVVTVVRAGPKFTVLARNRIGEAVVASPALSQGCIFLRGDKHLFCIREK